MHIFDLPGFEVEPSKRKNVRILVFTPSISERGTLLQDRAAYITLALAVKKNKNALVCQKFSVVNPALKIVNRGKCLLVIPPLDI